MIYVVDLREKNGQALTYAHSHIIRPEDSKRFHIVEAENFREAYEIAQGKVTR